jgi:hypothetical protein
VSDQVISATVPDRDPGEPTVPYRPTFDTGEFAAQPDPVQPLVAEPEPIAAPVGAAAVVDEAPSEPIAWPAHPVVVPSSYQFVKRWAFVLVVAGVWIVAAAIGLGLYYWWYHSMDKTPPVFVVLMYMIVCTVGSLLVAMVQNKPLASALAIAMMSAPLASTAAAAAMYGAYVFQWIER